MPRRIFEPRCADRASQAGDRRSCALTRRHSLGAQGTGPPNSMELQLEDLGGASLLRRTKLAAQKAAARRGDVRSVERRRPSRKPFPKHLPRERGHRRAGEVSMLRIDEAVEAGRGRSPRRWK